MKWGAAFAILVAVGALPMAVPGVPAQAPGEFTMTDPEGDVGIIVTGEAGVGAPLFEQADILRVTAGEEGPDRLELRILFKKLLNPTFADDNYRDLRVEWKMGMVEYHAQVSFRGLRATPVLATGSFCRATVQAFECWNLLAEARAATNEILVWIPKVASNAQQGDRVASNTISAGAILESVEVSGSVQYRGNGGFASDRVPNTGTSPKWEVRTDPPAGPIVFEFARPGRTSYPDATLATSGPTLVPVVVKNLGPSKRLVNISAVLAPDEIASHWKVRAPQLIAVPGGQSRAFNVVVEAAGSAVHGELGDLLIMGRMLGFPSESAFLRLRAHGANLPTPERPTLYLQASNSYTGVQCYVGCVFPETWLNALENDPRAQKDAYFEAPPNYYRHTPQGGGWGLGVSGNLDTPLAADLVLRPESKAKVTVGVSLRVGAEITMEAKFRGQASFVGMGTHTKQVPAGSTEVSFEFPVTATSIPANDTSIGLALRFGSQDPAFNANEAGFRVHISKTRIELPLAPAPPDPFAVAKTNALLLQLKGDRSDLVNPGKSHAFRFLVVNQDDVSQRTHLEMTLRNATGEIQPAADFDLPPGESASVAAIVRAPDNAPENARIEATLTATTTEGARVQANVSLTVTRGAEISDEASAYTADPDSNSYVVRSKGNSPLPVGIVLLGIMAAVWRRR